MAASLQQRTVRGLVIGAMASVVLALLGAMGTDAAPLGLRMLYWAAVIMPGSLLGLAVTWAVQKWGGLSRYRWWEAAMVAVLVAVPHTFVVIVASALMFGITMITASTVIQFGLMVLLVSAVLTAINYLASPPTFEDVADKPPALSPATAVISAVPACTMPPAFADRLPPRLRAGRLQAIAAEDHYLRVHTDLGNDLVLMRIGDAAALLEPLPGARVHRSWWVARDAVTGSRSTNGNIMLELAGGLEVPVSRSAKRDLAADGWFEGVLAGGSNRPVQSS
jgi:DNA-binding LytR/AlgR family response regulator